MLHTKFHENRSTGHYLYKLLWAGVPDAIYQVHGNRSNGSGGEDF